METKDTQAYGDMRVDEALQALLNEMLVAPELDTLEVQHLRAVINLIHDFREDMLMGELSKEEN